MVPFTDRITDYVDGYSSGVSFVLNGYDVDNTSVSEEKLPKRHLDERLRSEHFGILLIAIVIDINRD